MDIVAAVNIAEQIVNAIVTAAPAITQGVVAAEPYVQAIAGMIQGTNATQDQIDQLLTAANQASQQFQQPLPADDGTTTT